MRILVALFAVLAMLSAPVRLVAQDADDEVALSQQVDELLRAGRYADALPIAQRALAKLKERYPEDDFHHSILLSRIAEIYARQGRYSDAEPYYRRALAVDEHTFGPDNFLITISVLRLADMHRLLNMADAEVLYKRVLALYEKNLGGENDRVAGVLNALATLYFQQERMREAEALYKRALAIKEKAGGLHNLESGTILGNLGELYRSQGRLKEAEPLLARALDALERIWGSDNIRIATPLNNLAAVYADQGRLQEAIASTARVVAITEKALGPDHPDLANSLSNLAELYRREQRFGEAEPLLRRSLAINEKLFGAGHPAVATMLNNLAELNQDQGRYAEAETLLTRTASIYEKAFGADNAQLGRTFNNLAALHFAQSHWRLAESFWQKSTDIIIRRAKIARGARAARSNGAPREPGRLGFEFRSLVKASYRSVQGNPAEIPQAAARLFRTAQWSLGTEAAASLAKMAARGATGDPRLSTLVREQQDLVAAWQQRDGARTAAISLPPHKRDLAAEAANADRLAAIEARITEINKRLATNFADYATLSDPEPSSVSHVQADLRPDEALVQFLDTPEQQPAPGETFVWIVTKTELRWLRSDLGTASLAREVAALRCGLDATAWAGPVCPSLIGNAFTQDDAETGKPLPFDHARAHRLYRALFGEVEDVIRGKHLLLVPSGALTQLPFQVLVTQAPTSANHKSIAWLVRDHALTVLPAVSSLKALRRVARPSAATKPMIGFGDPLLDGPDDRYAPLAKHAREHQRCPEGVETRVASQVEFRSAVAPFSLRGGLAEVAEIRAAPPLPETADELCAVARYLKADLREMRLGARATERELKAMSATGALASYRIVHFATHGALAGELTGTAEPGLILTPPDQATEEDDGYLSASEIAALKLDADWVILSACNTAAGGSMTGAEALSGLARAFFYAQARALLVSHWEVNSEATVKLITGAVGEITRDKTVGRAEALRRAMLAMIDNGRPGEAHPAYWAPFVVVGEGAAKD
jgi:CHAT domain-containing protein/tetratricopeptide (TPR) repeat protein